MSGIQKAIKVGAICLAVFIIICIFNGILFAASAISGFNVKTTSYSETYDNISNLDIDVAGVNIIIEEGEKFRVDAQDVSNKLKINKNNNVLKIRENNYFLFKALKSGSIKISVPEGTLQKLDIDAGAGTITIRKINASDLKIDQGAGTITIDNSNFSKADINGGAGEIVINDSTLNNLDLDCGVGKVSIAALLRGKSDIDCGVGELNLTLLDYKSEYKVIASKGIGSIQIDGTSYKNDITYGEGDNTIKIDGGVGAINISFKEPNI